MSAIPFDALYAAWTAWRAEKGSPLNYPRDVALADFNAQQFVTGKRDVSANEVLHYFGVHPRTLRQLQGYALAADSAAAPTDAQLAAADFFAMLTFSGFKMFQTSDAATLAQITTMLQAIASDPASGVTGDDVAAVLALADVSQTWAQAHNYGDFVSNLQLDERGLQ